MRAGNSVDADQEENLRIIPGREHHGEAVAGRAPRVRTNRRPGFHENTGIRKLTMYCRASSLSRRKRHAVENLNDARLLALPDQFEVSVSQTQRRSAPVRTEAGEVK